MDNGTLGTTRTSRKPPYKIRKIGGVWKLYHIHYSIRKSDFLDSHTLFGSVSFERVRELLIEYIEIRTDCGYVPWWSK